MSLPDRIAAYDDCFTIFDAALETGTRVCFATYGEAHIFMMRMHMARDLQRKETKRMYPPEDPRWGKTLYDRLIVRSPRKDDNGEYWVYIEAAHANILAIERLDPAPALLQLTGPATDATEPSDSH
jgi:hypothetical protein